MVARKHRPGDETNLAENGKGYSRAAFNNLHQNHNMITKQHIPNSLLAHRKAAGLRQIDVAQFLGLESTDRISRWEKGTAVPHLVNAFRLSVLYKASVHELYGDYFKAISASADGAPSEEHIQAEA